MRQLLEKPLARAMDAAMCGLMNVLQWRRSDSVCSQAELEDYLARWAGATREEFYRATPPEVIRREGDWLEWQSPVASGFAANDQVRVRLHPCRAGAAAPTVLLLHALMSASDAGYRRVAKWFNEHGWNAAFPHLPFHYSRVPRGYLNGELAITANLIRNGETLRQGVIELRQLMGVLRAQGCREFGILGTSYGGWNGALLSFLEADFRFVALIQPIANVEHAIWENPGAAAMRSHLRARGIAPGASERHAHLSSPMHGIPLCGAERVILTAGTYDSVSPASELLALKHRWPGARLLHVRQGHFGYRALRHTLREIEPLLGPQADPAAARRENLPQTDVAPCRE